MRTVLQIVSQWYTGSSILNLLLNAQPGVRGLGEASHIYSGMPGYCSCGKAVDRCSFCMSAPAEHFYRWCFEWYESCTTLVDSSKSWEIMRNVRDGEFPVQAIVLSRAPHAWLYSHRGHHREEFVMAECLNAYLTMYRQSLDALRRENVPHLLVTHEDLVADTDAVLRRICAFADITYNPSGLSRWWETDTHVIGGNHAVYRQLREDKEGFFSSSPRYKGHKHEIFLDESWKQDTAFRLECAELFASKSAEIDALLPLLGQPRAEELIGVLRA